MSVAEILNIQRKEQHIIKIKQKEIYMVPNGIRNFWITISL